MKKTKLLGIIVAVVTVMLVFSVSAFAADTEYTYGDFKYTVLEDDTVKIIGYTGDDADVTIPEEIDGKAVKTIGDEVFWDLTYIESVVIPDTVTSIGKLAFASCGRLSSLELPQGLVTIGEGAFDMCGIKTLFIPETVASIGSNAFWGTGLTSIAVDEDNLYYSSDERGALFNKDKTHLLKYPTCNTATEYVIPESVTEIEGAAFHMSRYLADITIPNGIKEIKHETFSECAALESIIIPDSVEIIYSTAFVYTDLKTITLGIGLKEIQHEAFDAKFEDVYYNGTKKQWDSIQIAYSNYGFDNANIHFKECAPHLFTKYYSDNNATCSAAGTKTAYCDNGCGATDTVEDAKTTHSYDTKYTVIKAATENADGSKARYCKYGCGKYTDKTTVPKIKSVSLSTTQYTHNGKNRTPIVTIKDAKGNTLVKNTDYTLWVASKRSGIGRYTVKVTFIGNYSGTKNVYFYIKPGVTSKVTSTSDNTSVTLKWNKVSGAAGYTVYRYSPSKKAYVKAGTTEGTSLTVKSLYSGTKYTFRVIAYGKTTAGKVYDSNNYKLYKTATCPGVTKSIKVTKSAAEYVTLQWESVKGATGYRVYVYDSQAKKWVTSVKATTKLTATVKNLVPGRSYNFAVKAYIKTDSGDVWAKTYTKITGKTGSMTDDYARKLLCEASKVDMKWWPASYITEDYLDELPEIARDYVHIIDPYDSITGTVDGKKYTFYAVKDASIKTRAALRELMQKYFEDDYVELCLKEYKYSKGKLYCLVYDSGYEVASYYTDSIKKISSTHYRYYLKAHFEEGQKGQIKNIYYDLIYVNGKWVFTQDYEGKRYNGEKADDVKYFYPIILGEYLIED